MKCPICLFWGFVFSLAIHSAIIVFVTYSTLDLAIKQNSEKSTVLNLAMFKTVANPVKKNQQKLKTETKTKKAVKPKLDKDVVKKTKYKIAVKPIKPIKPNKAKKLSKAKEYKKYKKPKKSKKLNKNTTYKKTKNKSNVSNNKYQQQASSPRARKKQLKYKHLVRSAIAKRKFYPVAAKTQRITGTVYVVFTLKASGRILKLNISKSSGSNLLDQAALKAVRNVGKFPDFSKISKRKTWNFTVPLKYNLGR